MKTLTPSEPPSPPPRQRRRRDRRPRRRARRSRPRVDPLRVAASVLVATPTGRRRRFAVQAARRRDRPPSARAHGVAPAGFESVRAAARRRVWLAARPPRRRSPSAPARLRRASSTAASDAFRVRRAPASRRLRPASAALRDLRGARPAARRRRRGLRRVLRRRSRAGVPRLRRGAPSAGFFGRAAAGGAPASRARLRPPRSSRPRGAGAPASRPAPSVRPHRLAVAAPARRLRGGLRPASPRAAGGREPALAVAAASTAAAAASTGEPESSAVTGLRRRRRAGAGAGAAASASASASTAAAAATSGDSSTRARRAHPDRLDRHGLRRDALRRALLLAPPRPAPALALREVAQQLARQRRRLARHPRARAVDDLARLGGVRDRRRQQRRGQPAVLLARRVHEPARVARVRAAARVHEQAEQPLRLRPALDGVLLVHLARHVRAAPDPVVGLVAPADLLLRQRLQHDLHALALVLARPRLDEVQRAVERLGVARAPRSPAARAAAAARSCCGRPR